MPENNHILIVDDNAKNLQFTGKILKDEGYLISLAADGKSALSILDSIVPAIILLDVMMPEMNGFEVCRIIKSKEHLKEIPVIFLTAKNQTEDLVEGFEAGGVDYITKPFRKEELLIRVKTHMELALSRKKIIELNRTRDKLYSIIAHDIRSPLSGIIFIIDAIKNGVVVPGTSDFVEIIDNLENSTNETIAMLNNLLAWSKVQSGSIALSPKVNNIHSILMECMVLLKSNADKKNIKLTVSVPESLAAYFDEVTMHTVFRNIITNAIKFTPENGTITINGKYSNGMINLIFKDSGVGISNDVMEKILVHNQHHTSRGTANEQGTGLGLVMIKEFVQKNNGILNISSKVNEGTEFQISLPLRKPQEMSNGG